MLLFFICIILLIAIDNLQSAFYIKEEESE